MPTQEIPTLKSQYADKVTADLDLNTAEQDRIRGEITSLQERLAGLEQDHELLVGMRAALGNALAVPGPRTGKKPATAAASTASTASTTSSTSARKQTGAKTSATGSAKEATPTKTSSAPKAAKSTAAKSTATKATATKSTATKDTAPKSTEAKPAAAKKPVAKKAAPSDKNQVPLTELIHQHLCGLKEPKTAGEIAQALSVAHPDRSLNDNLVRTSTERLVARSLAERAKQGSTVYYTATRPEAVAAEAPAATADKAVAATTV
ncbi:hypothetical protein ACIRO3_36220 [Streptomyces sp. NPDC102278]|uniref:hypothetical protein n=1 Tax=Streptomyces sp. NPDC102278 TaxID=3366152 RepID=UPI0038062038